MQATWDKYSIKGWDVPSGYSHEQSYLSDQIIDRVLNTVQPYIDQARLIPEQHYSFNAPDTFSYSVSMEKARAQTQDTISSLSNRFDGAVLTADKTEKIIITPINRKQTHGHGYCSGPWLVWAFNNSINNPIYFSHEFGHYLGHTSADSMPPWSVTEWQSHFVHLEQLERLTDSNVMGDGASKVATTHRHLELHQNLKFLDRGLNAVQKLKTGNVTRKDKSSLNYQAHYVHAHSTAIFIAIALREKFKKAPLSLREKMLDSLYQQGYKTTPQNILSTFGLISEGELEKYIKLGLNTISFDASKNLRPRPQILENI